MQITSDSEEFGASLRQFLMQETRRPLTAQSDIIESLTQVFVGTLQTRLGPVPSPESLVLVRDAIRYFVARNEPIQVLVPFGPKKPGKGGDVDLAELFVVKHLVDLDRAVSEVYAPGLWTVLRLEDVTGYHMEGMEARMDIETYCASFERLVRVFGHQDKIHVMRESQYLSAGTYFAAARSYEPYFLDHLTCMRFHGDAIHTTSALERIGWKGGIGREQFEHYLHKYQRIYPADTCATPDPYDTWLPIMARYFAGTLARAMNGGSGMPKGLPFVKVYFGNPVPGAPPQAVLYRRHFPLNHSKTHIAPWRAKAYLRVNGSVRLAQTEWSNPLADAQHHEFTFTDGTTAQSIRADVVLEVHP